MKRVALSLVVLMVGIMMFSCSSDAGIEVSVVWEDNEYFSPDADCYVAAAMGLYGPISGFSEEAFDKEAITPGTDVTVSFSTTISSAENVVVYVFYDNDGNGKYSDGDDLNDYENIVLEAEGADIELTPYY